MQKVFKLNDGNSIPAIGFETWRLASNEVRGSVKKEVSSLNRNYRLVNPVECWDLPYFS